MQENEFKNILKERASGFELEPSSGAFDRVMQKRKALKRSGSKHYRFFYYLSAASVIAALSAIFVWQPNPSPQGLALQNDRTEQIITQEKIGNSRQTATGTPSQGNSSEALVQAGGETADLPQQANDQPSPAQTGNGSSMSQVSPENFESTRLQADKGKIQQPKKNDKAQPGRNAVKALNLAGSTPDVAVSHEEHEGRIIAPKKNVPDNRTVTLSLQAEEPVTADKKEAIPASVNPDGASPNPLPVQRTPSTPIVSSYPGGNVTPEEKKSIGSGQTMPAIAAEKGGADSSGPGKNIPELAQAGGAADAPDSLQAALQASKFGDLKKRYWVISALVTPQVLNSAYSGNSAANDPWMKEYLANRKQNDKARFSYNAGVRVERMLGKHFSIGTGAIVSVIKFEELQIVKAVPPPVVLTQPNSNPGVGLNPTTSGGNGGGIGTGPIEKSFDTSAIIAQDPVEVNRNRFDISFTALEVPIMVNYHYHAKKLRLQGGVGIAFNYLLNTRSLVFEQSDSLNVKETDDASNRRLQQFSYVAIASVTAGYDLGKRFNIYAGPVFRYSLSSLYSNAYVIRQEPYFLGLELGLRFYL